MNFGKYVCNKQKQYNYDINYNVHISFILGMLNVYTIIGDYCMCMQV